MTISLFFSGISETKSEPPVFILLFCSKYSGSGFVNSGL